MINDLPLPVNRILMIDRLTEYHNTITQFSTKRENLSSKQKHLPALRLVCFILFGVLVYRYFNLQSLLSAILAVTILAVFILLSVTDGKLKAKIKHIDILLAINRKEVAALGGDYSSFDPGNEFVDQSHDYTHDLDIFGSGSLFQFINRAATIFGKLRLADYFSNAFRYNSEITGRQKSVEELSRMVKFRQQIQLIFYNQQIAESDKDEMTQWLKSTSPVHNFKLLKILAFGLPSVTLVCIALSIPGIISFPVFMLVLQLMIVFIYGKQTIKVQQIITSKSNILNRYAQCLHLIENTGFQSTYLADFKKQLISSPDSSPSRAIHQLSVILKYMDSNLNLLVAIILNGLFMFNLHLLLKVEKWKKDNSGKVPVWFNAIATFDALSSLANFSYNHSTSTQAAIRAMMATKPSISMAP